MIISNSKVDSLNKMDAQHLADCLMSGMLGWAIDGTTDRFKPHSFVALFDRPIEAIEALYSHPKCEPATQRVIRELICKLGSLCRPDCPETIAISSSSRWNLLEAYFNAVEFTLCFETYRQLGAFVTDGGGFDDNDTSRQVAGMAIGCLGKLALHHERSPYWSEQYRDILDNELIRIMGSPFFEASIAPFILASLVTIRPDLAIKHIELCGAHIRSWHQQSPTERDVAYLTANRIAEKAPQALLRHFEELSFRFSTSRDRWLVEALFSPLGPFQLYRDRGAIDPLVIFKNRPTETYRVQHEDWLSFFVQSTFNERRATDKVDPRITQARTNISIFFAASQPPQKINAVLLQ